MPTYLPPGVTGYEGRVEEAIDLKNKTLWMCFCRTETAWPTTLTTDDDNPPSPLPTDAEDDEPYLYVKSEYKTLCRPVTLEVFEATDPLLRVAIGSGRPDVAPVYYVYESSDATAYENSARWVYMRARLDVAAGIHPPGVFRQIKVYSGLIPAAGEGAATWLLPDHVEDRGKMRWIRNYPRTIVSDAEVKVQHIVVEKR